MNKIKFIFFSFFSLGFIFSQEIDPGNIESLLTKDYSAGLNMNTSGWGGAFEYSTQKNYKYKKTYGLLLTNIRHVKEFKIVGTSGSKGFFFGKINSLISLRPYYGGKLLLFKSVRENGVEISYKWGAGASFGLVKPVYVELNKVESGSLIHYPVRYDPTTHYVGQIFSRSPWSKGLGEAKINLGVFIKNGVSFNFSHYRAGLSGGEIGFMIDYFPFKKIELMYLQDKSFLFASLYLQFNLGKKF
ncbi:MAG TPA: hypothetical protein EYG85_12625 [Crocinitomix sp.]|nr:hypothetical protein [Crocinitomix sp.]